MLKAIVSAPGLALAASMASRNVQPGARRKWCRRDQVVLSTYKRVGRDAGGEGEDQGEKG